MLIFNVNLVVLAFLLSTSNFESRLVDAYLRTDSIGIFALILAINMCLEWIWLKVIHFHLLSNWTFLKLKFGWNLKLVRGACIKKAWKSIDNAIRPYVRLSNTAQEIEHWVLMEVIMIPMCCGYKWYSRAPSFEGKSGTPIWDIPSDCVMWMSWYYLLILTIWWS